MADLPITGRLFYDTGPMVNETAILSIKQRSRHARLALRTWLKAHSLDAALMLAVALVGLWLGLRASTIIFDDAMITFRVAENLASGRGFVFNPGERVQVTTTPLYAMLLAAGVWFFGSAPRAGLGLNLALATLIPVVAYDLGRRLSGRITGLGGALLLMLMPLLVMAFSMESYLYVALILAAVDAYAAGRWRLAGGLAGLTGLVRGDAILLPACMLSYDVLAQRRFRWELIIPAIAIPTGWYLFATFYYGWPFPATLSAKVAQGEFNWLGQRFIDGLAAYWDKWTRGQDYDTLYLFLPLVALGAAWAAWKERPWLILIARDGLYVTAFVVLAVPAADWYYASLAPGLALLSARGVQAAAEGIARWAAAPARRLLAIGLAGLLLAVLLTTLYPISQALIAGSPDWKAHVYPETARWIAANTNPSASLATIDIGHLGYWSERPIVDIVGLAQPDVSAHIAQGDFGYAIRHYQPDLVLIGYSWLPEVQAADWFQADYAPRRYFNFDRLEEPLVLFSRKSGVKVQPDLLPGLRFQPLDVDFNRQIRLAGYRLNQPLIAGSNLILTLDWQAKATPVTNYTVFVQLVDGENHILAQADEPPQQGFYSTVYWQPGEQIIDTHLVPLDRAIPPGRYAILLGLYDGQTGGRLQILNQAGKFESDYFRLDGIEVLAE